MKAGFFTFILSVPHFSTSFDVLRQTQDGVFIGMGKAFFRRFPEWQPY